jgi:hypothetical protein
MACAPLICLQERQQQRQQKQELQATHQKSTGGE